MTGYTEFVPINIKAVFTNVDLEAQQITASITYQEKLIATLTFHLRENTMIKVGNFDDVCHFKKHGIDEQFFLSRIKGEVISIIENNISEPDDFFV
ncbi:hypothetical protein L3476_28225 [Paenibacillus thiaminolyticus]|uniref:hypothetical protein n=1 Tax=Paenibacillus thiaminolyticus TaxID=49283 RepID=UPI0023500F17|nr:hypothetical protein [Paenibacillus thiaminolyticus]WCR27010.1 hypothetical protein L3476_28225 [Paenibacillus thiaminolyticus]